MSHDNPAKSSEPRWGDSRDREALSEPQGGTPRTEGPVFNVAVSHDGCGYLALEDSVCNRCGKYVKPYRTLERELAQMARDLADANHWRERHSNDSEARGKQSHEHWLKWQAAERLVNELEAKLAEAQRDAEHQRENKNGAYLERNHLVAALARLFPSGLRRTDIPGWSADWHGCCMIDLPTGQISYHFHDSQAHLFDGLPPYKGDWDGHDKDTVHARLAALAAERKESGNG